MFKYESSNQWKRSKKNPQRGVDVRLLRPGADWVSESDPLKPRTQATNA